MAWKRIGTEWNEEFKDFTKHFICDEETDTATLPKCIPASDAVVVSEGCVYMVNASGEWVKFGGIADE